MRLRPSSAARRVACPGSAQMEAVLPDKTNAMAEEGTAAHFVASQILHEKPVPLIAPNGVIITDEMRAGVNVYVEHVKSIATNSEYLFIENELDISRIHKQCSGTCDCWYFDMEQKKLHVWDFKYGFTPVKAYGNYQLLEYAAGAWDFLRADNSDYEIEIHLHIVQPRVFFREPVQSWKLTAEEIKGWWEDLKRVEEEAASEYPRLIPSSACKFCKARINCSALQKVAYEYNELASEKSTTPMTNQALGGELKLLKQASALINARITGLEEDALDRIYKGQRVPFFKILHSRGRLNWIEDKKEEAKTMATLLGVKLTREELMTPTQAISAGIPDTLITQFSERKSGEAKLVEDTGMVEVL